MDQLADAPPTVLVVEDDPDLLAVLQRILASEGYEVRTALDGESGLNSALDSSPGLVILDVGLPLRSGMDVARALYLDVTGQLVAPAQAAEGRKWIVEDFDLFSAIRSRRDGALK